MFLSWPQLSAYYLILTTATVDLMLQTAMVSIQYNKPKKSFTKPNVSIPIYFVSMISLLHE